MAEKAKVLILMGSDSDWDEMKGASEALEELGIPHEIAVASAHRTPDRVAKLATSAHRRGIGVIIAGAGGAAHLAGVVAAHALLPVIGVPLSSTPLAGFDALLATAQMPAGIPVATMAVGKPGARNAGLFAGRILGLSDSRVFESVEAARATMRQQVAAKDRALQARLREARKRP
jgi:phosphoribosylaminoimidazole carboxylase PurE protein